MDELLLEAKRRVSLTEKREVGPPALETRNLSVWYNDSTEALRKVSVAMYPRRITSVIGPSGCGKSTFLRALNRIHSLGGQAKVEGHIFFEGIDINLPEIDEITVRRRIGLILQRPFPFPHLNIFDNVASGLRLLGVKKRRDLQEIVQTSLEKAAVWNEVKDRLGHKAIQLSSGQQQRVCIARALAVEPQILLLDEPTSSLDPGATFRIEEVLTELAKEITIVIVTHSMNQAARISDDTIFMMDGTIAEAGRTDQIFTTPQNPITMDYITGRLG